MDNRITSAKIIENTIVFKITNINFVMPSIKHIALIWFEKLLKALVVYNKSPDWGRMACIGAEFIIMIMLNHKYSVIHNTKVGSTVYSETLGKLTPECVWEFMLRSISMYRHRETLLMTSEIRKCIKFFLQMAFVIDEETRIRIATIVGQQIRGVAKRAGLPAPHCEKPPDAPEVVFPAIPTSTTDYLKTHFPKSAGVLEKALVPGYLVNPLAQLATPHELRAMCLEVHPDKFTTSDIKLQSVAVIAMIVLNRLRENEIGPMPVSYHDIETVLLS